MNDLDIHLFNLIEHVRCCQLNGLWIQ